MADVPAFAPLSLEYVAGLFDGEGCISIYRVEHPKDHQRAKYQLQVAIVMREGWLLEQIQRQWGGSLRREDRSHLPNQAPVTRWRLGDRLATEFLRTLEPHLRAKREQAFIALHFRAHTGNDKRHDPACITIREDCYWVMRYANRRGVEKRLA